MDFEDLLRTISMGAKPGSVHIGAFPLGDSKAAPRYSQTVLPEAAIAEMQLLFADYRQPRFKPGDLITARENVNLRYAGMPGIVVETAYDAPLSARVDSASYQTFGQRLDIRVMFYIESENNPGSGPTATCWWNESWQFIPWEEYLASKGEQ